MDYEADFKNTIRETIGAMQSRNKAMISPKVNGVPYTGWRVDSRNKNTEKGSHAGWHEEYWEQAVTVLLPDGTFKEVGSWSSEDSQGKKEGAEFVYDRALSYFVGNKGKPFAEWKAKLERLPYQ
ncbi:hypothetical protein [Streptomyces sp. SID13031]|uniref:hypothetical protein n=1 Tax=Streptomyces sp. SID13031 TaxID=2706046 RepID=UPI0013CA9092|nr:hypothetical protein [Streptomyces sp. SID13031]NEA32665.1 hypothetical protein [Streptomyces sp. SID13031]